MKQVKIILLLCTIFLSGCGAKLKGFSIGVVYLNTDMRTTTSHDIGPFGTYHSNTSSRISEIVPIGLLNFEFGEK